MARVNSETCGVLLHVKTINKTCFVIHVVLSQEFHHMIFLCVAKSIQMWHPFQAKNQTFLKDKIPLIITSFNNKQKINPSWKRFWTNTNLGIAGICRLYMKLEKQFGNKIQRKKTFLQFFYHKCRPYKWLVGHFLVLITSNVNWSCTFLVHCIDAQSLSTQTTNCNTMQMPCFKVAIPHQIPCFESQSTQMLYFSRLYDSSW